MGANPLARMEPCLFAQTAQLPLVPFYRFYFLEYFYRSRFFEERLVGGRGGRGGRFTGGRAGRGGRGGLGRFGRSPSDSSEEDNYSNEDDDSGEEENDGLGGTSRLDNDYNYDFDNDNNDNRRYRSRRIGRSPRGCADGSRPACLDNQRPNNCADGSTPTRYVEYVG